MSDYVDETGNAAEVSGFGGRPLRTLKVPSALLAVTAPSAPVGRSGPPIGTLAALGFEDCEQLVAASAVRGVQKRLRKEFGLDKSGFQSLLNKAKAGVPERVGFLTQAAPRDLGRGVITPSPDVIAAAESAAVARDSAVFSAQAEALSESVNLIPFMPPIRNQGGRPTCVAFALTALNEYVLIRSGIPRGLSEQHLYYEIKLIDDAPTACGTWQSKAVTALRDRGQCLESIWLYDPTGPCDDQGVLPSTARSNGLEYRLETVAVAARSVAAYQAHLAKRRPVTFSIPVYDSWYQSNEVRRSGRITMRIGNEPADGGHALVAVGYQNTPSSPGGGHFIVRNSWGLTWANESPYGAGYGTIPYNYITNDAWEANSIPFDDDDFPETTGAASTGTTVQIKVGSNVEITIEDGTTGGGPAKVSKTLRPGKVS
jgi:C1A family cysteine protease